MINTCKKCKSQFIAKLSSEDYCKSRKNCLENQKKLKQKLQDKEPYKKVFPIYTSLPQPIMAEDTPKMFKSRQRVSNPQRPKPESEINYHYVSKYGITLKQYHEQVTRQEQRCGICGRITKKLYVDHDHVSGKVRGLLCTSCNSALGQFRDSIDIIESALFYLNMHKCISRKS